MAKKKNVQATQGVMFAVRREFGGMPVEDAKVDLSLVVNSEEVRAAAGHEKDPENCILARACRRQLRSSKLLFFRSVAFVHHPGDDGVDRVYRYKIGRAARAIIEAFDRKKKVTGNVMVTLEAPKGSNKIDAIRERGRRNSAARRARKRNSLINGQLIDDLPAGGNAYRRGKAKDLSVRSGTGMVHFNVTKEQETQ